MTAAASNLLRQALELDESERAPLVTLLIKRLEGADQNYKSAWEDEIARRIKELDEGVVRPIPWSEARRRIIAAANGQRQTKVSSSGRRRSRSGGGMVRRPK